MLSLPRFSSRFVLGVKSVAQLLEFTRAGPIQRSSLVSICPEAAVSPVPLCLFGLLWLLLYPASFLTKPSLFFLSLQIMSPYLSSPGWARTHYKNQDSRILRDLPTSASPILKHVPSCPTLSPYLPCSTEFCGSPVHNVCTLHPHNLCKSP